MLFEKIIEFCKENNIPIYIFERECDLGNGTIASWKESNPRIDSVRKVAKRMGISIGELLGESNLEDYRERRNDYDGTCS